MLTVDDMGEGGCKNHGNSDDVLYGRPLNRFCLDILQLLRLDIIYKY